MTHNLSVKVFYGRMIPAFLLIGKVQKEENDPQNELQVKRKRITKSPSNPTEQDILVTQNVAPSAAHQNYYG